MTQGCPKRLAGQGTEPRVCANATQLEGCYAQELETTWEMQCPEGEHRELAEGTPHNPNPQGHQDSNTLNKICVMIN